MALLGASTRKSAGGRELPAKNVQQLLGHSSIVITLDLYGHIFPKGNDRAELEASEAALWRSEIYAT
jgi:integrase